MQITTHAGVRMNQRGINKIHVDLVMKLGEYDGDKVVLSQKMARERINELKQEMKTLESVVKKGGVTIVSADDYLITTYRTNSYSVSSIKKVRG